MNSHNKESIWKTLSTITFNDWTPEKMFTLSLTFKKKVKIKVKVKN